MQAVIKLCPTEDGANILLSMGCLGYFANFFNDHRFRLTPFAGLVAPVLRICNGLILQAMAAEAELTQKLIVVNETLEVYRFIVERYAAFQGFDVSVLLELARFLDELWRQHTGSVAGDEKVEREKTLLLSSIMRIMSHLLAKMPLIDLDVGVAG